MEWVLCRTCFGKGHHWFWKSHRSRGRRSSFDILLVPGSITYTEMSDSPFLDQCHIHSIAGRVVLDGWCAPFTFPNVGLTDEHSNAQDESCNPTLTTCINHMITVCPTPLPNHRFGYRDHAHHSLVTSIRPTCLCGATSFPVES